MLYFAQSDALDIYENLALEDHLLDHTGAQDRVLFLWRANDAVVQGKNQNPWLECNLPYIEREGIELARRISGGGTVFHDAGNLNYCFIVPRWSYEDNCIYTLVLNALARLGINAKCTGKNGLVVGDKKIGGTAYCYRKDHVLHHGTLLLDANLERLNKSLQPVELGISSHSIRSKPAAVTNLGCGLEELCVALQVQAAQDFECEQPTVLSLPEDIDARTFASEAWIYDRTPRFTYQGPLGELSIHKGRIIASDNPALVGQRFRDVIKS